MNKKGVISIIIVLVLIVLAIILFADRTNTDEDRIQEEIVQEENQDVVETETTGGTITAIDTEQAMVDGPYVITLDSGTTIALPSMGILLCSAREELADVGSLEVGQIVEVRGSVGPEGQIVPCESPDHYLRVVEE